MVDLVCLYDADIREAISEYCKKKNRFIDKDSISLTTNGETVEHYKFTAKVLIEKKGD